MTIPNLLSVLRIALIPLFILAVVYGHPTTALFLFVGAGLTDALDGFIARFFDQRSELGAFLDPMADKLMLTATYVALALPETGIAHPIPVWVPVLTIARDVMIVTLSLILNLSFGIRSFPPSLPGKCTTFVQIAYAVAVLLQNSVGFPDVAVRALMGTVAFFTLFSGIHYLFRMRSVVREAPKLP
jgi:cardiolipin synthase